MMKMNMNQEEYVKYFSERQLPGLGHRKISKKILDLYEKETGHSGDYYQHSETLEKIRDFLKTLEEGQYWKLSGEKRKRNRGSSLLKNTKLEIKSFPIDEELDHHWEFLEYDLENKQKYAWNMKERIDRDKNRNQIYFNPPELIDEFLALKLHGFPFTNDEKQRIIKFLENYGPYFIKYPPPFESRAPKDKEWYFWHFWMDFDHFRKAYELIKSKKPAKFPNARIPSKINEKTYSEWNKEVGEIQLWFNICLTELVGNKLPSLVKAPHDIRYLGRGIAIACHYLNQQCKN